MITLIVVIVIIIIIDPNKGNTIIIVIIIIVFDIIIALLSSCMDYFSLNSEKYIWKEILWCVVADNLLPKLDT